MGYTVDPGKRVREILGLDVEGLESEIPNTAELTYSFQNGYERLEYRKNQHSGSMEFTGVYHPNGYCEGVGICKWCGCTLPH